MIFHSSVSSSTFGEITSQLLFLILKAASCFVELGPYRRHELRRHKNLGNIHFDPKFYRLSQGVWFIMSGEIPAGASQQSVKTMLGNLWRQQCNSKSTCQEASRSWFYVIFKCITKGCSKNEGLLTCALFYVQSFQQKSSASIVLALFSLPFPHPFSDSFAF